MKKALALVLALCCLMSCTVALAFDKPELDAEITLPNYQDYSSYPIVKDGEKITVSIMCTRNDTNGGDAAKSWWWNWLAKATGIDLKIEQVSQSAQKERKNLTLVGGELPDVMWSMGFTTDDIVRYGVEDQLLLAWNDYITPELMPNLCKLLEERPEIRKLMTAPDGKYYGLPFITQPAGGADPRMFIDQNMLDEVEMDTPRTIEELTQFLYAVKEKHPEMIPLGGAYTSKNSAPLHYIFSAFGYIGNKAVTGKQVNIRNGKAVIPGADPEFKVVLELLHQYYQDGIISPDFFTMDRNAVNAQMAEGLYAIYPYVPGTVTPAYEDYGHWFSVYPLTSEYNDTPMWYSDSGTRVTGVVASAETEHPEALARMFDFMYSELGYAWAWFGPYYSYGEDVLMGYAQGWYYTDSFTRAYPEVENGTYASISAYCAQMGFGLDTSVGWSFTGDEQKIAKLYGLDKPEKEFVPEAATMNEFFIHSMNERVAPYLTSGFPTIYYLNEKDSAALTDLLTVIQPYIETELAKFIKGDRSLDEYDTYLQELKNMGIDQVMAYYNQILGE